MCLNVSPEKWPLSGKPVIRLLYHMKHVVGVYNDTLVIPVVYTPDACDSYKQFLVLRLLRFIG